MTYVVSFLPTRRGFHRIAPAALLLLAVISATVALAQQALNGTWEGETKTGAAIVLTLTVKGTEVSGTLKRGDDTTAITEGKVSKNTVTFKAVLNGEPEALSAELTGDELKAWLDRQGPSSAIVLKRVKKT